ncbi:MAG: transglycosylase SLT domain-containing protein [Proteobacteria bacterium]|nr:transglycosylase SLT domain-containing protein [Pseudomonadota bacterium]
MASIDDLIEQSERERRLPPGLLRWLLTKESSLNPNALGIPTSSGRAQGIAQFMPGTAAERGVNPWDVHSAIPGAADYLEDLARRTGSWHGAVSRYGTLSGPNGGKLQDELTSLLSGAGVPEEPHGLSNRAALSHRARVMQALNILRAGDDDAAPEDDDPFNEARPA